MIEMSPVLFNGHFGCIENKIHKNYHKFIGLFQENPDLFAGFSSTIIIFVETFDYIVVWPMCYVLCAMYIPRIRHILPLTILT